MLPEFTGNAGTPGSPSWWLHRLTRKLDARKTILTTLNDYYEGRHPLIFATDRFTAAFGSTLMPYADNFVSRIVDAVTERLFIDGFRVADDEAAADELWRIWQVNQMESGSQLLFREALVKREAAVIVWAGEDRETPRITVEDPLQVIVETVPGDRLRRRAALKRWTDEDGTFATLYLPDAIYKFWNPSVSQVMVDMGLGPEYGSWKRRDVPDEPWPLPNPLGVVPVVPVINRPKLNGEGRSEIEPVIPLQDAINKTGADMLIASEFSAFRQRWATGLDIPTDPDTGAPFETFQAAVERLWATASTDVKFGEFSETNLENYVKAIEMQVQHLSSISGLPLHYLLNSGVVPSGESQTAAESPLVSKVNDRAGDYSGPIREIQRLVFLVKDDPARAARPIEPRWRDPERRTPSEWVDSLVKELALGVPEEILWEKRGYTKQQIDRIKAIRLQRDLEASAVQADILAQLLERGVTPEAAARLAGVMMLGSDVTRPALPALPNGG
jgi:hypothetical protein